MAEDTTRDIVLRLEGKVDQFLVKVQQHDCDLNGNGKPGLKSDMRAVQSDIAEIKKSHEQQKDRSWQIKALFIGEGISILGIAVAILLKLK